MLEERGRTRLLGRSGHLGLRQVARATGGGALRVVPGSRPGRALGGREGEGS